MSPFAKSALTWAGAIAVLSLFFAVRFAWIHGVFTFTSPVTPGVCRPVATGVKDPADLVLDAAHNALFVAAVNRQADKPYSDKQDGLYLLRPTDPTAAPLKLNGPPADFHPYGISLFRAPDGSETLMVVDRKTNGRDILETYDLTYDGDTPKLVNHTAIQSGLLVSPHGMAAAAPDHFYVSNDYVIRGPLGRFAEEYLIWPHADVMAYNGMGFRIATQRLAYPAGLLLRNNVLYVAVANSREVQAFTQDIMGYLDPLGELSLPARPDKISLDDHGNLIVAGEARPGSSQVYRVMLDARGAPQSYETIFSDNGGMLKGASAAVTTGNQLFIGASDDNKMLACTTK